MKKIIYLIDSKINLITILFLFWTLFWGLNGLDKFFNGKSQLIFRTLGFAGLSGRKRHAKGRLFDSAVGESRLVWREPRCEIF